MKTVAVISLIVICFMVASTLSYHDAVDQHKHCMAMIDQGAWPEALKASC